MKLSRSEIRRRPASFYEQRNGMILRGFLAGSTLMALAGEHDVTVERIRQIVARQLGGRAAYRTAMAQRKSGGEQSYPDDVIHQPMRVGF